MPSRESIVGMEEKVAFFVRCRAPTGSSTAVSAMIFDGVKFSIKLL